MLEIVRVVALRMCKMLKAFTVLSTDRLFVIVMFLCCEFNNEKGNYLSSAKVCNS